MYPVPPGSKSNALVSETPPIQSMRILLGGLEASRSALVTSVGIPSCNICSMRSWRFVQCGNLAKVLLLPRCYASRIATPRADDPFALGQFAALHPKYLHHLHHLHSFDPLTRLRNFQRRSILRSAPPSFREPRNPHIPLLDSQST